DAQVRVGGERLVHQRVQRGVVEARQPVVLHCARIGGLGFPRMIDHHRAQRLLTDFLGCRGLRHAADQERSRAGGGQGGDSPHGTFAHDQCNFRISQSSLALTRIRILRRIWMGTPLSVYTAPMPPAPEAMKRSTSFRSLRRRTARLLGGTGATPAVLLAKPMGSCPCAVAHMMESTLHLMIRPGYIFSAISASWPGLILRTSFCLKMAMTHCSSSTKVMAGESGNGTAIAPGRNDSETTVPSVGARYIVCSRRHSASASCASAFSICAFTLAISSWSPLAFLEPTFACADRSVAVAASSCACRFDTLDCACW